MILNRDVHVGEGPAVPVNTGDRPMIARGACALVHAERGTKDRLHVAVMALSLSLLQVG